MKLLTQCFFLGFQQFFYEYDVYYGTFMALLVTLFIDFCLKLIEYNKLIIYTIMIFISYPPPSENRAIKFWTFTQ